MMIRTSLIFLGLVLLSASAFAGSGGPGGGGGASVPEPGLVGLMAAGLAGVAIVRRRAKSKRNQDK